MARYKAQECNSLLLPVMLCEQIVPGSFAFALNHLIDHELDLSELDARFRNDQVGASAYDPRVMLKIVLLAYSQGLVSNCTIEQMCQRIGTVEPVFANLRHNKRLTRLNHLGRIKVNTQ
jgi:transposase